MNPASPAESSREELIALIATQAAEIAVLKAHIAELERRLGLNSSNSGKPPSSDGLKKPPRVKSLREPSDKAPGGQKGHKGETLRQVTAPSRIVDHYPPSCSTCPNRHLSSSPNIAPTTAGAPVAGHTHGPRFPKGSTRRCNTARRSQRS